MAEIWDFMDCEGCPRNKCNGSKALEGPGGRRPKEECSRESFGGSYPCERMLSRIEEGLRDGDFGFSASYLVSGWCLTDPETKNDYWDVRGAWPDIDWAGHRYWQIFYDETRPSGFDTAMEVYRKVFQ
ncbi:MAG: hypothetical protein LBK13_02325 [Spirochaetales bacterium]|jgi:hypothetical protein|nr:hypothetical protein [Spirochaetales bacterium]